MNDSKPFQMLLALVRNAIWQIPLPEGLMQADDSCWQEVFTEARLQTVHGIAYDAVKRMPAHLAPSRDILARWLVEALYIERQSRHNSAVVERLRSEWEKAGIHASVLKGVVAASMYPVPEHRVSGDIDWGFMDEADWNKAREWACGHGSCPGLDSDGDIHYLFDDVVVEHHRIDFDVDDTVSLLVSYNLHIFKHISVNGIGLRHFCDLALAYSLYKGRYDERKLVQALKHCGLLRWSILVNSALVSCFGLDPGRLPVMPERKSVEKDVDRMMRLVRHDANFGLHKRHRYSGFIQRMVLLSRYAPKAVIKRWASLFYGRLRKKRSRIFKNNA